MINSIFPEIYYHLGRYYFILIAQGRIDRHGLNDHFLIFKEETAERIYRLGIGVRCVGPNCIW
jgi:hypothetical protein